MIKDVPEMVIHGVVDGQEVEFRCKEIVSIDRHNLDDELAKQAEYHQWVSINAERAAGEVKLLEAALEDLDTDFAAIYINANGKVSEWMLKLKVKENPERRKLVRQILEKDQLARDLASLTYALMHRKEMLHSLALARGAELSTPTAAEVRSASQKLVSAALQRRQ